MKKHVDVKSLSSVNVIEPFYSCLQVEVDSNDEYILSCFERLQIKILNISTGFVEKCIPRNISDEIDPIVSFVVNEKDDNQMVIAHSSGLLKQWNWKVDPPQLMRTWKSFHSGPVSQLVFDSFDGSLLASGGSDAIIKVWDTKKQYCTHHLKGAVGVITAVAFQPLPSESVFLIADVGDKKYNIAVWNLVTSKLKGELVGHISAVTSIKFKDQDTLISSSRDKMITIWNLESMAAIRNIITFESVESAIFLDGLQWMSDPKPVIVCAGESGSIKTFDTSSGKEISTLVDTGIQINGDGLPLVKQLKYLKSRNELMVVSHENNIIFRSLSIESLPVIRQLVGHMDEVLSIKFIGSGHRFIAIASNSPNIKVYDLSTSNCLIVSGHKETVLTIDTFASDPSLFVSSSKDNKIRVWKFNEDTLSVRCLFQGSGHSRSVTSVVVPVKSTKWIVSGSEDTIMKLWRMKDIETGTATTEVVQLNSICSIKGHEKDINSLAVAPNDQLVCSGSQDKSAKLWSVENDGQLKLVGSLTGHRRGIWCVKFSPVDQVVVTSSSDMTCKIWALNDFTCIKTFQGHDCAVLTVTFITRGMQLMSTGTDGNIKIWSVKGNECQKTIDGHTDKVWTLCPSKDESHFVTGGADSRIVVWKDVTADEVEEECNKVAMVVQAEQGLRNLIEKRKWKKALKLAIHLDQPFRCLTILREINLDGDQVVFDTLNGLRNDQIMTLVKYSLKWNTNSKFCLSAQQVMKVALTKIGPTELLNHPDCKEIVASFMAYTDRHYSRTQKLVQQMNFLGFIFENMRMEQTGDESDDVHVIHSVSRTTESISRPKGVPTTEVEELEGSSFVPGDDDVSNDDDSDEDDETVPTILGVNDLITIKENRIKQKKMMKAKIKAKNSVKMKKTRNK